MNYIVPSYKQSTENRIYSWCFKWRELWHFLPRCGAGLKRTNREWWGTHRWQKSSLPVGMEWYEFSESWSTVGAVVVEGSDYFKRLVRSAEKTQGRNATSILPSYSLLLPIIPLAWMKQAGKRAQDMLQARLSGFRGGNRRERWLLGLGCSVWGPGAG